MASREEMDERYVSGQCASLFEIFALAEDIDELYNLLSHEQYCLK